MNEASCEDNSEGDTSNPSKVLTVVGESDEFKVIQAVQKAWYKAERL